MRKSRARRAVDFAFVALGSLVLGAFLGVILGALLTVEKVESPIAHPVPLPCPTVGGDR